MTRPHDPLDALRQPTVPVAPDAAFAARLRARLESAVLNPKGTVMTNTETAPVTIDENAASEGDVVYSTLFLPDIAKAAAFYPPVLGWQLTGDDPVRRDVGNVSVPTGLWGDTADSTLWLCHAVDDVHAAVARVRAAGGQADEPVQRPHGFVTDCTDNQGMRFAMVQLPKGSRERHRQPGPGELLYLTVQMPDSGLFRDFYGAVFGWTFTPGRIDDGWSVTGVSPMMGMRGGADRPAVLPMYGVRDVAAAVAAVRAGGGTSTDPERQPYGTTADCTDDQGVRFYLGQV
jgi:predicted enzyme related to lactoylglutathione lyase